MTLYWPRFYNRSSQDDRYAGHTRGWRTCLAWRERAGWKYGACSRLTSYILLLVSRHLTSAWPSQVFEQEDGLGLRVGTPFRGDSARSVPPEPLPDSRGSERPRASRGAERRSIADDAERLVLDDRPSDSRSSQRPKAPRGGDRGSERARAMGEVDRILLDEERPIDSRGGERPKVSRGSDRLKSRGGDREKVGRRGYTGDGERSGRNDVIPGDILLNQDKLLTLEDWFSNPGLASDQSSPLLLYFIIQLFNPRSLLTSLLVYLCTANQLPKDFGPSQSSGTRILPDEEMAYVQEDGLGMRVLSAVGSSRTQERDLFDGGEKHPSPRGQQKEPPHHLNEISRAPSDRAKRLALNLAQTPEEIDSPVEPSAEQLGQPTELEAAQQSHKNTNIELQPQTLSLKSEDKPAGLDVVPAVKTKETGVKDVQRVSTANRESKQENRGLVASSSAIPKKAGESKVPTAPAKRTAAAVSPSKAGGTIGTVQKSTAPRSSVSTSSREIISQKMTQTRPIHSRPMTKESSQEPIKSEPSRLSTARSNISTASSTSAQANRSNATVVVQARIRHATAPSENTPRSNALLSTSNNKEIVAEKSKDDVGDKTARLGTSVVELTNMKILEHALDRASKLKSSPLARTARFGPAIKNKDSALGNRARPTSPRPQDRVTTAPSATSLPKDTEMPELMKKRPPWNPSTLDTLYSPRKPDSSPPKTNDASPNKREKTPGRDAVPLPVGVSARVSPSKGERASPTSAVNIQNKHLSNNTTPSRDRPPRHSSRGREAAGVPGTGKPAGAKAVGAKGTSKPDKPTMLHPPKMAEETETAGKECTDGSSSGPGLEASVPEPLEVKTLINEESTSSSADLFTIATATEGWGEDRIHPSAGERIEGEGAGGDNAPLGNEFLIPPEFQNLERPLTRRDERPNTRRDERPATRGGLNDRPTTRGGLGKFLRLWGSLLDFMFIFTVVVTF